MKEFKLKRDRFSNVKGGNSKVLDIICTKCNSVALVYQKDGVGALHRCYLNRIIAPEEYERLQHNNSIDKSNTPKLLCGNCGEQMGVPMRHEDGRLAFRLIPGKFSRKIHKGA